MREFVTREIVGRVTERTQVSEASLRGALAAAQIIGLATTRYVVRLPAMVEASHDDLRAWLGPAPAAVPRRPVSVARASRAYQCTWTPARQWSSSAGSVQVASSPRFHSAR